MSGYGLDTGTGPGPGTGTDVAARLTDTFWWFAYERQRIWYERTVRRSPPPWTADARLAVYRFCNVQRELDRGTVALLAKLHERQDASPEIKVLNVLLHRYFNQPDVAWVESQGAAVTLAHARVTEPRPVGAPATFSRAWVATESSKRPTERVASWRPATVLAAARGASSLRDVLPAVSAQAGFGRVNGWQATLDLTYLLPHLHDDEWVPEVRPLRSWDRKVGTTPPRLRDMKHGPAVAARCLCPTAPSFQAACAALRDTQDEGFTSLGVRWADVAWPVKPRLTLADIEHTLCEYNKWTTGRSLRRLVAGS